MLLRTWRGLPDRTQQALAGRARPAADKFTSVPEPQPETEWETESEGGPEELMVAAEDSAGM